MKRRLGIILALVILLLVPQELDARKKKSRGLLDRAIEAVPELVSGWGAKEHKPAAPAVTSETELKSWQKCGLPKIDNNKGGKTLYREGYITSYNASTLLPNWVAWRLTPQRMEGNAKRGGIPYAEDTDVKPRQELQDWSSCGKLDYDHGHMCPAGDNKYSAKAMEQTFLLTNMCPQRSRLNQETWERLESACRKWANKLGEIYIVCGPIFRSAKHRKMGTGKIHIPDAFYKVILYMDSEPRGIGFVYENADPVDKDNMQNHVVPITEIEKMTGITFFPSLPASVAAKVKNVNNFKSWNKF